jgi:hypothetical protein
VWEPKHKVALCVAAVGAGITGQRRRPAVHDDGALLDMPNDVIRGVTPPLQAIIFAARFVYFLAIGAYDSRVARLRLRTAAAADAAY